MIVIDATALVEPLLDRSGGAAFVAEVVGREPMHAPEMIDLECLNTLRRLVRRSEITEADGDAAAQELEAAHIVRYRHRMLRPRVWELRHNLSSYDASYLALAEAVRGSTLMTGDNGLYQAAVGVLGTSRVLRLP